MSPRHFGRSRTSSHKMRVGVDPGLVSTRQLTLASIADTHDHLQFRGDGSPRHPHLYDRDVFVFLPFQANRHRFVIPYYVMTRDITKGLAPEEFTVKIRGIDGRQATVVVLRSHRGSGCPRWTSSPRPPTN